MESKNNFLGFAENAEINREPESDLDQQTDATDYSDDELNEPTEQRKKVKTTKQPLAKKSKKQSKEECLLDEAISVIKSKKDKVEEPEDIFGKTVACSLKRLNGKHMKEYAKFKIQEVLFRCHSSQNQQSSAPRRTPFRLHTTAI